MAKTPANGKIAVKTGKPTGTKSQPFVGKLKNGTESMPGSKGKGQAVKTVASNPIQGKTKSSGTAMGGNGVIEGFVK